VSHFLKNGALSECGNPPKSHIPVRGLLGTWPVTRDFLDLQSHNRLLIGMTDFDQDMPRPMDFRAGSTRVNARYVLVSLVVPTRPRPHLLLRRERLIQGITLTVGIHDLDLRRADGHRWGDSHHGLTINESCGNRLAEATPIMLMTSSPMMETAQSGIAHPQEPILNH